MCLKDVLMGRNSTSNAAVVAIGAGAVKQVLPADPYRYSIVFSGPSTGSITYSINQNPGDGEGIVFHQGCGPIALTIQHHGDMVRRPWYAYSVNAVNVAVHTAQMREE